uniref:Solute carrier family 22 member 6 n=1 Tax=Sinocyclocheilus rhinocerous TaxID=307959 RepID=A0A673GU04_9TELE
MGFADLLDEVGGFGRFQMIHVALLSIPGLLMASQNLLNNFTAGVPEHHCRIPNITAALNESTAALLRAFIPLDSSRTPSKCTRYTDAQWHLITDKPSHTNATELQTEACAEGWTYDKTEFISSIVSEVSLFGHEILCYKNYFESVKDMSESSRYSLFSCRFGRKAMLIWSYFQLAVLGTFTALSPSYVVYCIFRFLTGMSVSGVILNAVSLKVEWIPTKARTLVGTISSFFFTFGQMILAGVAYSLKDWRKIHVAICLPFFIFFFYSWWYSESARWLVLNGRSEEALKHLHRVAKINGKPEMTEKITLEVLESHMQKEVQSSKSIHTVFDLLKTPTMRKISMCLMVVWFSTSFAYYGLAMDLQKFGVNIYLMQIIFGAVDFPAKLVTLLMLSFLGRRITQGTCLLMSASVIFANIFVPKDMQITRTALAVLGKGFTSASFTCIYLFTGELYPTVIRQTGMGFVSTMARIGSMAAPAVLILEEILPALPSIVYGGSAVLAGFIAFLLPETLDIPLPDTIEDVEEKGSLTLANALGIMNLYNNSLQHLICS